jgi:hypothetical protein
MACMWLHGHFIRDPAFADVKLAQATYLRQEAAQIWHRLVKSINTHREDDDLDKWCVSNVPQVLDSPSAFSPALVTPTRVWTS